MATALWVKIDGEHAVRTLGEIREKLNGDQGEIVLDFSCIRQITPPAVQALEDLATATDHSPVRIVLHRVNVDVYKVLKLMKLAPRFSYLN